LLIEFKSLSTSISIEVLAVSLATGKRDGAVPYPPVGNRAKTLCQPMTRVTSRARL